VPAFSGIECRHRVSRPPVSRRPFSSPGRERNRGLAASLSEISCVGAAGRQRVQPIPPATFERPMPIPELTTTGRGRQTHPPPSCGCLQPSGSLQFVTAAPPGWSVAIARQMGIEGGARVPGGPQCTFGSIRVSADMPRTSSIVEDDPIAAVATDRDRTVIARPHNGTEGG